MLSFSVSGVLLDVEGTTSSISFVHDEMFPYARRELDQYLRDHWQTAEVADACEQIARDAGHDSFQAWSPEVADGAERRRLVGDEVRQLMDRDAKTTGLKQLQGLIWRAGFESRELQSHLYDDVLPALQDWSQMGLDIRIYSSGSVAAQKLFFGHTVAGDLLGLLRGHYDTTSGGKRETASYHRISHDFGLPPERILFVSDVPQELDAASEAGLLTVLSLRPGNPPVASGQRHPAVASFAELDLR